MAERTAPTVTSFMTARKENEVLFMARDEVLFEARDEVLFKARDEEKGRSAV